MTQGWRADVTIGAAAVYLATHDSRALLMADKVIEKISAHCRVSPSRENIGGLLLNLRAAVVF
jgi:hypothetical protein